MPRAVLLPEWAAGAGFRGGMAPPGLRWRAAVVGGGGGGGWPISVRLDDVAPTDDRTRRAGKPLGGVGTMAPYPQNLVLGDWHNE